jgi:hypothetical protein
LVDPLGGLVALIADGEGFQALAGKALGLGLSLKVGEAMTGSVESELQVLDVDDGAGGLGRGCVQLGDSGLIALDGGKRHLSADLAGLVTRLLGSFEFAFEAGDQGLGGGDLLGGGQGLLPIEREAGG